MTNYLLEHSDLVSIYQWIHAIRRYGPFGPLAHSEWFLHHVHYLLEV